MRYDLFQLQMRMFKSYEELLEDIEKEIDDICYQYMGVRAIQYDKEPAAFNSNVTSEIKEKMMEALNKPQKQYDKTKKAIDELKPIIESNLNKLPLEIQNAVKMLFWERKTYKEVGKRFGYSDHGILIRIKKEVDKI